MDVPVLADQQQLIYISSIRTQNVIWKTFLDRWMIGTDRKREKESLENLRIQHDDDDDDDDDDDV